MGGKNSGRKPNRARRARAARLRAKGCSLGGIAAALGCTRQAVFQLLRWGGHSRRPRIPCAGCATLLSPAAGERDRAEGLCLTCLGLRPDLPFGQRLRAQRLAAGLTVAELTRKAGLSRGSIGLLERGDHLPQRVTLLRLAAGLGLSVDRLAPRTGASALARAAM
jgi:DNA-binding XRE family transcriptional regulator